MGKNKSIKDKKLGILKNDFRKKEICLPKNLGVFKYEKKLEKNKEKSIIYNLFYFNYIYIYIT